MSAVANKIKLRIVTPKKLMYDGDVGMVIMRTAEGDMGVMPGHEAVTALLSYGVLRVFPGETQNQEERIAVLGGFAEIQPDSVTILSDAAELPSEIDRIRAEAAKERAEQRLKQNDDGVNVERAALALRRALVRMEVSSYPLLQRGGK